MVEPSERVRTMRTEYENAGLDIGDVDPDPMVTFEAWFAAAVAGDLSEPNAMVVSAVGPQGAPSSRTVLLKGYDARGFVFYTNYESRKGRELVANPACSLLFPWYPLHRQVRIEGLAEQVSAEESDAYFALRPRESQLGAWASHQSSEVADRAELDASYGEVERRFDGVDVPRPPHWGGFLVRPRMVEFWQGRRGRMHDRIVCRRPDAGPWERLRLAP